MKFGLKSKVCSIVLTVALAFGLVSGVTVYAVSSDEVEVIFTPVTSTDQTTLAGEAKIMVSVKGAGGNVSIAQTALTFSGDLKYKSIEFLQGENNPSAGNAYITPNAALANSNKELVPSIICAKTPMVFTDDVTDLFILTFSGEKGGKVKLSLDNNSTFYTIDGQDYEAGSTSPCTESASDKDVVGKTASVQLVMDKVTDFAAGGKSDVYKTSEVTLTITSENPEHRGYTIHTVLNNILVSKGGHRENETIPTFTVTDTVLDGDTYTVELSGIGYVTYKATGVAFDEVLKLTNTDFVPGDINNDGFVDVTDKTLCAELISISEYSSASDFNRDNKVDKYDMKIFDGIEGGDVITPSAPAKMSAPTVTGGAKQITVKWTKPSGSSVTGYVIKYGTNSTALDKKVEITNADITSKTITGLSADTTYYVSVSAINSFGEGEASAVVNAKTNKASEPAGGGGGGGGGGGAVTPTTPSEDEQEKTDDEAVKPSTPDVTDTPDTTVKDETFTDLGNYAWAKDSIYTLKDKGVISGISETEYAPASNIKRGDFILILVRMLGVDAQPDGNFEDVPVGSYYYDAIARAKAAGIATGDGVNFMPQNTITRQDLITLAYRAFLGEGYISESQDTSVLDSFKDKDMIADYAKTAMASMVSAGIIKGDNGNVNPVGYATRAEVAVMCARLMEIMNNG